MYISEKELKVKSREVEEFLIKNGINAEVIPESIRDYSIKIDIKNGFTSVGCLNLYHKPSKNIYKYSLHELKNVTTREMLSKLLNIESKEEVYTEKGYEADIDGSYMNGKTGFAAIIRKDGKIVEIISGLVDTMNVKNSHQVAGELRAAMETVKWCTENKVKEITVYYDMKGIQMWAEGFWKRKAEITKSFFSFMSKSEIKINWVKLASHSGHKWNEEADKIAKAACKSKKLKNR